LSLGLLLVLGSTLSLLALAVSPSLPIFELTLGLLALAVSLPLPTFELTLGLLALAVSLPLPALEIVLLGRFLGTRRAHLFPSASVLSPDVSV
jgi:hypothetical protein